MPIVEGHFGVLRIILIVLFTFDSALLRCSSKFSFLPNCIPKCFWEFVLATAMLLKVKGGWDVTDLLREKINSWPYLEISGLKLIFHWKVHCIILAKSLFKSFVTLLILCTVANNEVLSTNKFGLHWRSSDKSLIQIRNKRDPRIHPCGTPVRTSLQDECWQFRTTLCFRDFKNESSVYCSGPADKFHTKI